MVKRRTHHVCGIGGVARAGFGETRQAERNQHQQSHSVGKGHPSCLSRPLPQSPTPKGGLFRKAAQVLCQFARLEELWPIAEDHRVQTELKIPMVIKLTACACESNRVSIKFWAIIDFISLWDYISQTYEYRAHRITLKFRKVYKLTIQWRHPQGHAL